VPRARFALAQASLDAFDLGRMQAAYVARLAQEAEALLEQLRISFRAVRFAIG
jgi:hypothetical protein